MVLLACEFTVFISEINRITCAYASWRACCFCILFGKHPFSGCLTNGGELAAAIDANFVAGVVDDRVAFILLERFCKAVLCCQLLGTRRFGMRARRVWSVRRNFGLHFLWLRMVQPNIEGDFPRAVLVLLPDCYEMS